MKRLSKGKRAYLLLRCEALVAHADLRRRMSDPGYAERVFNAFVCATTKLGVLKAAADTVQRHLLRG